MRTSPRPLRRWAAAHDIAPRALTRRDRQLGGTSEKHLFGLRDGYAVESVLIRRRDGFTGLHLVAGRLRAFACQFCASGQAGIEAQPPRRARSSSRWCGSGRR